MIPILIAILAAPANGVSRAELTETVDRLGVLDRISGNEGERQANAYLKKKLTEYGVPFDSYEMELYLSHPMSASVTVLTPEPAKLEAINHAFSRSTPAGGVEGELVYIGRNMTADPFDAPLVDYEAVEVKGKIVLDDGFPAPYRAFATERAGAIAQIYINPDDRLHNMTVTTIWGAPTPETASLLPRNPIVAMRRPDGDGLRDRLARGEKVRVRVDGVVDTRWRKTELVVARVEGGAEKEKFVLIGGHIDSWHEGVTDNATGNAAMLEAARLLHRNRDRLLRSVRIAWWPGHSPGRYAGSAWYADHLFSDLRENAVAHINIDSIGTRSATRYSATHMAELERFNLDLIRAKTRQEPKGSRPGKVADESFVGLGIPSVRFSKSIPEGSPDRGVADGSGGSWWWHSREDSRDKVDIDLLIEETDLLVAMTEGLAAPPLIPYDFRATAKEMKEKLEAIENYDTGNLVSLVEQFAERADTLASLSEKPVADPRVFNDGLIRISRALNSVYYSRSGPYDQDTNELIPRFPGLAIASELAHLDRESDEARFLEVRLQREENRIDEALREATAVADALNGSNAR
jgi:Iap family predicted aminopeptidase